MLMAFVIDVIALARSASHPVSTGEDLSK